MFKKMNIGTRLSGLIGLALTVALILGVLGVFGLSQAQSGFRTVYEDRMKPVRDIAIINENMTFNRLQLLNALSSVSENSMNAKIAANSAKEISQNIETSEQLWQTYMATYLTPEEKVLAAQSEQSRGKYFKEALLPAIQALKANDLKTVTQLVALAETLHKQADEDVEKLITLQFDVAEQEYSAGEARFENIRLMTFGLLAGAVGVLLWLGILITRSITRPLHQAIEVFGRISNGEYASAITVSGEDEVSKVLLSLDKMQSKLGEDILATKRLLNENTRIRNALDSTSMGMIITDNDCNIIYTNRSVTDTLSAAEANIQKELPAFKVSQLLGANMDVFSKKPGQKQILPSLTSPLHTNWVLGGHTFSLTATPVFDADGIRLGTALEWNDITEQLQLQAQEKHLANENMRVKIALDKASTNVMMADNDANIIYVNESIIGMLSEAEADLRKVLTNFKANTLVGSNIDQFHKNPAHQRSIVATLKSTFKTQITVGSRTFSLTANPVMNSQGERLGTVVEWLDRTAEVAIENEVAEMVKAASEGLLSKRINLAGKSGFLLNLSESMNNMVGSVENVINETVSGLSRMSSGDLREPIRGEYEGSYKQIKDSCNDTMTRLGEIITEVMSSTEQLSNAAEQISTTSQSLSQATTEQASSVDVTSASIEQMAASINQNAENAKITDGMATKAAKEAIEGGEAVKQTVGAMKDIASKIGIIDDIAYQTNMLALNAAIEAARAGDHGKGFAVVAAEVRKLAERSQVAAQEISALAESSVKTAELAGTLIDSIVPDIGRTSDLVQEISAASLEQSTGANQINTAMNQMSQITQQNASASEELAATAEEMTSQAEQLQDLMGFFNINT